MQHRQSIMLSAAGILAILVIIGGIAVILVTRGTHIPSQMARTSASATSTATATLVPTATPTITPTPRPTPTATPKPPPNYLSVSVDRSSCQPGKPYPTLYFKNTDPVNYHDLQWFATTSDPSFFLHGGSGTILSGGESEPVEILPYNPASGPLTVTVTADKSPYTDDPGYWKATIQPC